MRVLIAILFLTNQITQFALSVFLLTQIYKQQFVVSNRYFTNRDFIFQNIDCLLTKQSSESYDIRILFLFFMFNLSFLVANHVPFFYVSFFPIHCICFSFCFCFFVFGIRFASVYRSFEDIREFGEEIAKLED